MKKFIIIPDEVAQRRITFPNDVTLRGVTSGSRSNVKEVTPFGTGSRAECSYSSSISSASRSGTSKNRFIRESNARKVATFGIILATSFIILKPSWAEEQSRCLQAVEFLTGFGRGELIQKKDYRLIPFIVDFDFNIKPLTKKIGFNPPSLVQFQIEPFISLVTNPETNMEVGTSFLLKLGLSPESWKLQPYIKGGVGMIHMTQHTLDQTTQFNFLINGGAGFHYFFEKNYAFTLEYRFRHASNASIKQPNSGIDNHFCLLGITHLF